MVLIAISLGFQEMASVNTVLTNRISRTRPTRPGDASVPGRPYGASMWVDVQPVGKENHRKTIGKWENHRKTIGKWRFTLW